MDDFVKELQTLIKNEASNTKPPTRCLIRKVYDDKVHADITLSSGAALNYVSIIGVNVNPKDEGLLVYLDEDCLDYVVICGNNLSEVITTIVTSWNLVPLDTVVPSEKLVKESLDGKIGKSSTTGLVLNDGTINTWMYDILMDMMCGQLLIHEDCTDLLGGEIG